MGSFPFFVHVFDMAGFEAISLNEENQPRLVVVVGVVGETLSIGAGGRDRSGRCMVGWVVVRQTS
jgi:hypothetical protein